MLSLHRLRRLAASLGLAALLGHGGVAAADAPADGFARAALGRGALLAGSERLRTFALGRVVEDPAAPPAFAILLRRDLERLGFYREGAGLSLLDGSVALAPMLGWDSNINGGLPNRELSLPGITLVATPETAARSGLVVGARATGDLRLGYRPGGYLAVSGLVESEWSPRHRIFRHHAAGSACARTHVAGWRFVDLCQNASVLDRDLGRSRAGETALDLVQLFAAGPGLHEARLGLARRVLDGAVQPAASLALASVWPGSASRVSATLAAPAGERLVQRWRVGLDLRREIMGRPVVLDLAAEEARGGRLFGIDRRDRTIGALVTVPVHDRTSLRVGIAETRSTVDLFDERRIGVSLSFEAPEALRRGFGLSETR